MSVTKYYQDLDGSVTIQDDSGAVSKGAVAVVKVDGTGNPVGVIGKDGNDFIVISQIAPINADGRPDGTIYIQTAP